MIRTRDKGHGQCFPRLLEDTCGISRYYSKKMTTFVRVDQMMLYLVRTYLAGHRPVGQGEGDKEEQEYAIHG